MKRIPCYDHPYQQKKLPPINQENVLNTTKQKINKTVKHQEEKRHNKPHSPDGYQQLSSAR